MTRSATDFSRSCRAPPLGAPGAAEASGGWVFLDVHEFESKSALGPGGNRGPGPSTPSPGSRLLALSARPWLLPFPLVLFRDEVRGVSRFFSCIRLPEDVSFHCGCREARSLFSSALMQAGARMGYGGAPQGEKGREASPHPCLRWGSRRLSSVGLSPAPPSHGSSPKTEIGELEGVPSPEFCPWDK